MKYYANHIVLIVVFSLICSGKLFSQEQITNLPTFYITTDDGRPVVDKDNYKKGHITVKSSITSEELNMEMEIRGRGNSTWGMPKKPYRIKLDSKTRLLNLPAKAKSWVLLANYADKSLMRNALAFKISELLELEFSPSVRFVDVVLNNEYLGNYILTDQVEVGENRVPIEEQQGTENITGGYLIEVDGFANSEPNWFSTSRGVSITIKYPKDDEINSLQNEYIKTFTQKFENVLFSPDFRDPQKGYRSVVDEHSLINWYIACELTGNPDSFWSIYIYKYRNIDKFYFGPLWDFDIAFNNDDRLGNATLKLMRTYAHEPKTWIRRLWEDQWFRNAVNRRWKELINDKNIQNELLNYIAGLEEELSDSQKLNFNKWKILNQKVYQEVFLFPNYKQGVDFLAQYINDRIQFLTKSFASTAIEQKPFEPGNSYFAFINAANGKSITVENNSVENRKNLVLWEPDSNNDSQLWEFISTGNNSYQIINRKSTLAVSESEAGIGQDLIQTTPETNNKNQHWTIVPLDSDGLYGIVNILSGYAIDNSGGGFSNGNAIIKWNNEIFSNRNQQWYIKKIANGTNILDFTVESQPNIYPNPVSSSNILTIRLPEGIAFDHRTDISLKIYTLAGKCIYQGKEPIYNNRVKLDMSSIHILPDLYILRIGNYNVKLMLK